MPAEVVPLREQDAAGDPWEQFARWWQDALPAEAVREVAALATSSADGQPSVRMVLVHPRSPDNTDPGAGGFLFYSNYGSRKGTDLDANPRAALAFHWPGLGRQVRAEGKVARLEPAESDRYWQTRPLGSRLSAVASRQSQPVSSREQLERRVAELAATAVVREPDRPPHWGGYRLHPVQFEFWQHRDDRLHDRLAYIATPGGWEVRRLQP